MRKPQNTVIVKKKKRHIIRNTQLICSNDLLRTIRLSLLHEHLMYIDCSRNLITKLPNKLPAQLNTLIINNNLIKKLPDKLPQKLRILIMHNNLITQLPVTLPLSLYFIDCTYNNLCELPNLTLNIQYMSITQNNTLRTMYSGLTHLEFMYYGSITHKDVPYINDVNARRRTQARMNILCATGNPFLEPYMRRMMHPDRLKTLRNDESIDVDEYMTWYVESL